jgi:hypothetical protein
MSLLDALTNLPRPIARHTLFILTEALPAPIGDLPEERAARDEAAIAAVAALHPADASEAALAARSVAAGAWAMDCLRLAGVRRTDPDESRRCRREADVMMRDSDSALRTLRSIQADAARQQPPALYADQDPATDKNQPTASTDAPPSSDIAIQADEYALRQPKRAALIRRLGHLPERINCGPMTPKLVHAIVTGTSAILRSLDRGNGKKLRFAA